MPRLTRVFAAIAIATLSALIAAAPGYAAIISRTIDFTGSNFDFNPPVDPVTGSFAITFDNAANLTNQTTGLSIISFNITVPSGIGFDYYAASDTLLIGGLLGGVNTIPGNVDDFMLAILDISTVPEFQILFYTQADNNNTPHMARSLNGTVGPLAVPEPASLALFGAGIVAAGLIRRRKSVARAAGTKAG